MKALCLGARAVLIGRAYAYGLGAAGGAGVADLAQRRSNTNMINSRIRINIY